MHNKRIITMSCLIILLLCLFCACNGSNKNSDVTDKPEISQSAGSDETLTGLPTGSPTEIPTATPTEIPTETPTEIPTEIPTLIPVQDIKYDTPENLAKNRELHSKLKSFTEYAKVGTGKNINEKVSEDIKYGIYRSNPTIVTDILPSEDKNIEIRHVYGLKDETVTKKINDRIDEVVGIFLDPYYYTYRAGVITFMKEHGPGTRYVSVYDEFNRNHLISFRICYTTRWEWEVKVDAKDVPDYDGGGMVGTWDFEHYLYELSRKIRQDAGGIRYEELVAFDSLGYFPEDKTFRYNVTAYTYEEKGLTFNLETGEELRLSDFFEEGEDYLKILSDANYEQSVRYNYRVHDGGDYEEFRRNYGSDDHWWADYYEEFREYDAGNLYKGIKPDQEYYLSGWEYIYLINDELYGSNTYLSPSLPIGSMVAFSDIFEKEEMKDAFALDVCGFSTEDTNYLLDHDPPEWAEPDAGYKTAARFNVTSFEGNNIPVYYRRLIKDNDMDFTDSDKGFVKLLTLSDEGYVNLLMEYLEQTGFRFHGKNCYITIDMISKYPNGYSQITWSGKNNVGPNMVHNSDDYWLIEFKQWVKDGKTVSPEELIDIPMEELLKLYYSKLRAMEIVDDAYVMNNEGLSEEDLQRVAELLAPHVAGFDANEYFRPIYDFRDYNRYYYGGFYGDDLCIYPGMITEEELETLPEIVLDSILNSWGDFDWDTDSWNYYLRHFKIYEGYDF